MQPSVGQLRRLPRHSEWSRVPQPGQTIGSASTAAWQYAHRSGVSDARSSPICTRGRVLGRCLPVPRDRKHHDRVVDAEQPDTSTLREIIRDLPRRKIALVVLIVALNLTLGAYWRGCQIDHERYLAFPANELRICGHNSAHNIWFKGCVPPWQWTADEWRETVFPWK